MPTITHIRAHPRHGDRVLIDFDDAPSLACAASAITELGLARGLSLSNSQHHEIECAAARLACSDAAGKLLRRRSRSIAAMRAKLLDASFDPTIVHETLQAFAQLGYVDDRLFARDIALAASRRRFSRQRAAHELQRAGIEQDIAAEAIESVYPSDDHALAGELAASQLPRLRKLEPTAARRRLGALLSRRGFDPETIEAVVHAALGPAPQADE